MNANWRFFLGVACGVGLALLPGVADHLHAAVRAFPGLGKPEAGQPRKHTAERFSFTANAPMDRVFPLFGADRERVWAPHWNPQFVHPVPAADVPGMVFTVAHDHLHAVWVNTQFDPQLGRVQYVYTIPGHLVTVITLNVEADEQRTRVDVEYDRTSLVPEADAQVEEMAKQDRTSGPEWEKQINDWLLKPNGPS